MLRERERERAKGRARDMTVLWRARAAGKILRAGVYSRRNQPCNHRGFAQRMHREGGDIGTPSSARGSVQ